MADANQQCQNTEGKPQKKPVKQYWRDNCNTAERLASVVQSHGTFMQKTKSGIPQQSHHLLRHPCVRNCSIHCNLVTDNHIKAIFAHCSVSPSTLLHACVHWSTTFTFCSTFMQHTYKNITSALAYSQ